jgi:hypothetical protein
MRTIAGLVIGDINLRAGIVNKSKKSQTAALIIIKDMASVRLINTGHELR